jgi:hypothetical protein
MKRYPHQAQVANAWFRMLNIDHQFPPVPIPLLLPNRYGDINWHNFSLLKHTVSMTFQEYTSQFEAIINKRPEAQAEPYTNPAYLDYTRLNWSRMNRWLKMGTLNKELNAAIRKINAPQQWLIITEPWCGDAAHCIPFIQMAASLNPLIAVSYKLRDSAPFSINQYLTNDSKSIPKLVVRDDSGTDLAIWGPRPYGCQQVYNTLIAEQADFEQVKTAIQVWYNADKGVSLQAELVTILQ